MPTTPGPATDDDVPAYVAALGLPGGSPVVVGGAVGTLLAIAAVVADDPRAGLSRAAVAGAVAVIRLLRRNRPGPRGGQRC